jgi:hypothetical protein
MGKTPLAREQRPNLKHESLERSQMPGQMTNLLI